MVDDTTGEGNNEDWTPDRPRGVLTQADRELLLSNDEERSKNEIRDARYRIRQRVQNAIKDFGILAGQLDDRDRKLIFQNVFDESSSSIIAAYTFFYLGNSDLFTEDDADDSFHQLLQESIRQADLQRGYLSEVDIDVTIDRTEPDVEDILDQLYAGRGTTIQFNYLVEQGRVKPVLEHIIENSETLRLWSDKAALEEGEEDESFLIGPALAERMLDTS